jgi:hypothetical protein
MIDTFPSKAAAVSKEAAAALELVPDGLAGSTPKSAAAKITSALPTTANAHTTTSVNKGDFFIAIFLTGFRNFDGWSCSKSKTVLSGWQ